MGKLTNKAHRVNGRLCHEYVHQGQPVMVCDSARNMLLVIELFADEELTEQHKAQLLPTMLFAYPQDALTAFENPSEMLIDVLYQACGLDASGGSESVGKTFDWDEDADRIKASLRMAYGIEWETACDEMSFMEICGLLGGLCETQQSTPFSEAIHYRVSRPPEPNKYNQKERESFLAMRDHFALSSDAKPSDQEASALFDRLWKGASNG